MNKRKRAKQKKKEDRLFYSKANIAYLKKSLKQFKEGKYAEHEIIEVNDEDEHT